MCSICIYIGTYNILIAQMITNNFNVFSIRRSKIKFILCINIFLILLHNRNIFTILHHLLNMQQIINFTQIFYFHTLINFFANLTCNNVWHNFFICFDLVKLCFVWFMFRKLLRFLINFFHDISCFFHIDFNLTV